MTKTMLLRSLLPALVLATAATRLAAQCPITTLSAEDRQAWFGYDMTARGDWVVAGGKGSVYALQREGLHWFHRVELSPPDGFTGFGRLLDFDGDTVVVTARVEAPFPFENGLGAAYVFERVRTPGSAAFAFTTKLLPQGYVNYTSGFGRSIAVGGDWIAVGAPTQTIQQETRIGTVHLYQRGSGGWEPAGLLQAPDDPTGRNGDGFGTALAFSGDTLVVGAPGDEILGARSGTIHVYQRSADTWTEVDRLLASDGAPGRLFGSRLALENDVLVVGGATTYVFERLGGAWLETERLTAPDAPAFGACVALSGDHVLVGSPGLHGRGAGILFRREPEGWKRRARLEATDPERGLAFGDSVGLTGEIAVIGAPPAGRPGYLAGTAYTFSLSGQGCRTLTGLPEVSWGQQDLHLSRGAENAGHVYLLVGSVSGTSPGFLARGHRVPLLFDPYLRATALARNTGFFSNNLGRLDGNGEAHVRLRVPRPDLLFPGSIKMYHAFVEFGSKGQLVHVSNVAPVWIPSGTGLP